MIFGGDFAAEPAGGMRDLLDRSPTLPEAVAWCKGYLARCSGGWARIYDSEESREVWTDAEA